VTATPPAGVLPFWNAFAAARAEDPSSKFLEAFHFDEFCKRFEVVFGADRQPA